MTRIPLSANIAARLVNDTALASSYLGYAYFRVAFMRVH